MEKRGTLGRLATELTLDERLGLLEKLTAKSSLTDGPLYEEVEDSVAGGELEIRYGRLPWFLRAFFFVIGLFKTKSPLDAFQDAEFARIGRAINARAPGLYDHTQGLLLPKFYETIIKLKDTSRFFYAALDAGFNQDKGAFYAFLGSLEMGEIHARLCAETNPAHIAEQNPGMVESALRQIALRALDDITGEITDDERGRMYADARSLLRLKELSSFLFDRLLLAFTKNGDAGGMVCSPALIRDNLINLNNVLCSLREVPSMILLESLFVFMLQGRAGEAAFNIEEESRKLLGQAEASIAAIREFNKRIPLTLINRCAARNAALSPTPISGGEDWFLMYRDHWKDTVEQQFREYFSLFRQRTLQSSYHDFFQGIALQVLANAQSDAGPQGVPIKGADALSFLRTFYAGVFMPEIKPALEPIVVDGEFYKPDTQLEFAENYNTIFRLEDMIDKIDDSLAPAGHLGKRYAQLKSEICSLPVKRRKIQQLLEEVNSDAEKIIRQTKFAFAALVNILSAILQKDPNGKSDTLSNLPRLAGKGTVFVDAVTHSIDRLQRALEIMQTIESIDSGQ